MYTQDDYERIEAWLDGHLSEAEKQAFEQQMETDGAFHREVNLHRQLHQTFSDQELLRFKNALERVMKEPAPPDGPPDILPPKWSRRWLFAGLFLAIAALIGWAVWQWNRPVAVPSKPPAIEEKTPIPSAPTPPSTTIEIPPAEPEKPKNRPIAADFAPSRAMDMMVGNTRSEGSQPEISSPLAPDTSFSMDKNGLVKIRFSGKSVGGQEVLELSIFNNRDSRKPVFSTPFKAQKGAAGPLDFDFSQPLRLSPGLYYFFLREQESGGLFGAGRFTVHAR